jgi:hypothetical protein
LDIKGNAAVAVRWREGQAISGKRQMLAGPAANPSER